MYTILSFLLLGCGEKETDTDFFIGIEEDTGKGPDPNNEPGNEPDNPPDTGDTNSGQDSAADDEFTDNDGDGYSEEQGDCNDDSNNGGGAIHPDATDFINDGIDQDCVGGDATLIDVLGGLVNGDFDIEDSANPGYPEGWSNEGDACSWQGHESVISDSNGDATSTDFPAHIPTPDGGAVMIWGEGGTNPNGGSHVYQEFAETAGTCSDTSLTTEALCIAPATWTPGWSPAGRTFWLFAWGLQSPVENFTGTAEAFGAIICLDANGAVDGEITTQKMTVQSFSSQPNGGNNWQNMNTHVQCGPTATVVRVAFSFIQVSSTDAGAVFFDDVEFGQIPVLTTE
jgi:hypothetical protein